MAGIGPKMVGGFSSLYKDSRKKVWMVKSLSSKSLLFASLTTFFRLWPVLQTTGARSAFKLGTGHMIAPALGSMAACFSYFMRFVIGKFHANLFAQCSLSLALGMCSGIAEPQWWRRRLSCQRNLPRRPRRTNPPQVRDLFFVLKSESIVWFFLLIFCDSFPLPDSSSSDSSSDSDSDSSSSSSSSDDEDEKKEEKKKKKKKEWRSKLVPAHKHLPLFHPMSVVSNYLTIQNKRFRVRSVSLCSMAKITNENISALISITKKDRESVIRALNQVQ